MCHEAANAGKVNSSHLIFLSLKTEMTEIFSLQMENSTFLHVCFTLKNYYEPSAEVL